MLEGKVMLEVTPPLKRASSESIEKTVKKIAGITAASGVDLLNVPEIINENHDGIPLYRNMDTREFGSLLKTATGKDVAVNKVTAHLTTQGLEEWLDETIANYCIKKTVLVGGNSHAIKYPGPSVTRSNAIALKHGAIVGNICIPDRLNEVQRLVQKTRSGCSFFTTQILFEAESMKNLLTEYAAECKKQCIAPATFFLCFAPISDLLDVEYIKWLGAKIPSSAEQQLRQPFPETSIRLASEIYKDIREHARSLHMPTSVSIEPISSHNLELSTQMINALA